MDRGGFYPEKGYKSIYLINNHLAVDFLSKIEIIGAGKSPAALATRQIK